MKPCLVLRTSVLVLIVTSQLSGCVAMVGVGVAAGAGAIIDPRSAGTMVDDQLIEFKSVEALTSDPEISDQSHINVTSYNNMVLLSGEVPNQTLRTRAAKIVERIPKVRGVYDELSLAAPSSMLTRSTDSVITGKVKTSLIGDENIRSSQIKVVTESGTVFLMGLVTRAEGTRSTEVSRRIGGVRRVVILFEYLD